MTGANPALGRFVMMVDGRPVSADMDDQLIGLRAEQSLTAPDIFEVTFQDDSPDREATAAFKLGGMLLVRFDTAWQPGLAGLVFQGNITTVESTYDDLGNVVVIRAYDATHRLMHGRRTEAYPMMGYADVVRKVATRRGVPIGRVDPVPGPPHDHITQADMDDWTFLLTLAEECGYDLFVSEGKLNFQKVAPVVGVAPPGSVESEDPLQIMRDDGSLITLRTSVTAGEQVGMIEVRGWDPATKRVIPAKAKVKSAAVASGTALPTLANATKSTSLVYALGRPSIDTLPRATAVAEATAFDIGGRATTLVAEMFGDPRLKAGALVSLSKFDPAVNGKYRLTSATHTWDPDLGYRTTIEVTDRRSGSVLGLTGGASQGADSAFTGVVPAIVTDVKDPKGMYRVKVKYPWLSPDYVSGWARLVQAGAGGTRGTVMIPEVDDEVLVAFEEGDPSRPYVLGGLYNAVDKAVVPQTQVAPSGKVLERSFHSRTGHRLTFNDGEAAPKQSIELVSGDKKVTVTLAGENGVAISVLDQRKVIIDAAGDVEVTSKGNVKVTATASMELEAATVKIKATGSLEMSGATVKIDSTGPATVTGKPIKLN
jgi:phage protein D/phage baseplate assembly protein gpV